MSNELANFLTTACTGTGQATFYNTASEQEKMLQNVHDNFLHANREWYAISVVLPMNDKSRQMILKNLLSSGKLCEDGQLESNAIGFAVSELPFNRVLNIFNELVDNKINNSRTRRLGHAIWAQVDAYRAIKYATKIRKLLRHCHIPEGNDPAQAELHRWIYGANKKLGKMELTASDIQYNPKLKSRLLAQTNYDELFNLPFDIARDIAVACHNKKPADFEREFVGKGQTQGKGTTTKKESMRARARTKDTSVDFSKFSLYDLCMHAHKNPTDRTAIEQFVKDKAIVAGGLLRLPDKTALVIDNSISMLGSADRIYHPLVVTECLMHMCMQSCVDLRRFFTNREPTDSFLTAEGCTNLRRPLVEALVSRPELIIVISDGYENVRSGSIAQIIGTDAVKNSGIHILHLNPVVSVESKLPTRKLSEMIPTFTLATPEQLPMISLVALASVDPSLLAPMFESVGTQLRLGDYRAAKQAIANSELPTLAALS